MRTCQYTLYDVQYLYNTVRIGKIGWKKLLWENVPFLNLAKAEKIHVLKVTKYEPIQVVPTPINS